MATDTTYFKQPTESIDQYNSRIAAYNASKNSSSSSPTSTTMESGNTSSQSQSPALTQTNDFLTQLQNKLLGQSDVISSESTQIESKINEAIKGIKEGTGAGSQAVESAYNRQIGYTQEAGGRALTAAEESQRGYAVNTAALKQIQETTDRQVNDLEQRKQELILQGQASAAGQISQLQLQALQFRQQAQQQVFQNLLSGAGIGLQLQQQQQQASQFQQSLGLQQRQVTMQEDQAKANIALQYGLTAKPGESLESLYSRAVNDMGLNSPAALAIKQLQSQITANNAQTQAALASAKANQPLTKAQQEALASAYNTVGSVILGQMSSATDQANVIVLANTQQSTSYQSVAQKNFDNGISKSASITNIMSDQSIVNKAGAIQAVNGVYGNTEKPSRKAGAPGVFTPFTPYGAVPVGSTNFSAPPPITQAQRAAAKATFGTPTGGF